MQLILGDCLERLREMNECSVDSIVTDPPYGISFMGKKWDYDVPSVEVWAECLRVLKPGGHLLAFAGTRTQHRMAVRIEDAGFEIRDMIAWVYGSGFPKSLDVSKAIDKRGGASVAWFGTWFRKWREARGISSNQVAQLFPSKSGGITGCVRNWELGFNMPTPEQFNLIRDTFGLPFSSIEEAEREVIGFRERGKSVNTGFMSGGNDITAPATEAAKQWQGWGTALKPALEPITVARKPLGSTVAECVLAHGTGGINVDGCRVGDTVETWPKTRSYPFASGLEGESTYGSSGAPTEQASAAPPGRWPANLIHDGSEPADLLGEAARFFYCAKASKRDRDEGLEGFEVNKTNDGRKVDADNAFQRGATLRANTHPTVKPTDLMRYLCRLVTPPSGTVLDPFMGSGSTGKAAMLEGFQFIGIERDEKYMKIAEARIQSVKNNVQLDNDL